MKYEVSHVDYPATSNATWGRLSMMRFDFDCLLHSTHNALTVMHPSAFVPTSSGRMQCSAYGSEIDSDGEEQLARLMEDIAVNESTASSNTQSLVAPPVRDDLLQQDGTLKRRPWLSASGMLQESRGFSLPTKTEFGLPPDEVEYDGHDLFDDVESILPSDDSPGRIRFESPPLTSPPPNAGQGPFQEKSNVGFEKPPDTRSPLERFRTHPRKPLSVTDLISPAWCELQYFFNLSRHGKKPSTPAMKRGSSVHKELEEQIYETVQVDVQTREDHWGLRIWNVIQGLRTLRVTGMTRELEIWGVLDGEVINGVIDELSYICTDAALEQRLDKEENKHQKAPPSNQQTISQFFASQKDPSSALKSAKPAVDTPRIYLTDIKTRSSPSIPRSTALRPTYMQLMLYRLLLARLASNAVDASVIFQRYSLKSEATFSDALMTTLATLDYNFRPDASMSSLAPVESDVGAIIELAHHNTLKKLWMLMMEEFAKTIPAPEAISRVLSVEFRRADDSSILGTKTFPYIAEVVEGYVEDELRWWKGQREARGVDIEEAFKCGMCEFADGCDWRKNKIDEAVDKSRRRRTAGTDA